MPEDRILAQAASNGKEYRIVVDYDEGYGDFMEESGFHNDWTKGVRLGEMAILSLHRRYNIGHDHHMQDSDSLWEAIEDFKKEFSSAKVLPLYCYEHSMIALSTKSFIGRAHHAEWDSGQIGWIVYDEGAMSIGAVEAALQVYGDYINGNVFYIQLEERIKGEEWVAVETFGGVSSNEVRDTAIELAYYAEESEVRNELIKQIKEEM